MAEEAKKSSTVPLDWKEWYPCCKDRRFKMALNHFPGQP
jgi:hypothetical protein